MTAPHEERRCRRGSWCVNRETTRSGQLLDDPTAGYCPADTTRLVLALDRLDALVDLLRLLHLPSLETRYRTDDTSRGAGAAPPILINEHADALTRLLDHEVSTNAELVAAAAGVPWDTQAAAALAPSTRIRQGCQLLGYRVEQWLRLPDNEYEARSLGTDPTDGHDPDTLDYLFGRWWVRRDGPAAANAILRLYQAALGATGGTPSDWVPVPCRHCGRRTLHRQHATGVVRCSSCGDTRTDDAHDAFVAAALQQRSALTAK
jgi:ribosomal protein L37E